MKNGLLLVERMVLESIGREAKSEEALVNETGLNRGLLLNVLSDLKEHKLIEQMSGQFIINKDEIIRTGLNKGKAIREEVKDLFVTLVNQYFEEEERRTRLKVRKVWVTPFEEKILNSHFDDLENFVKSLKKRDGKMKESRVVLWGEGVYGDLVNRQVDVA